MEVNEAYDKLNISDQELRSIADYMGSSYNEINLLLNMEPYKAAKLENSNWTLPESVEDVFEDIERFKNIYFAMLKNRGVISSRLYRGISDKECKYFNGRTDRIVNTIQDEGKAKEFVDEEFPAIITYKIKGEIPYIDLSTLNNGEGVENGREGILLSPSARISEYEFIREEDGIKYYESTLEDGDFRDVDEIMNQRDDLEQYIRDNFNGFRRYVTEARTASKVEFDIRYKKAFEFKKKLADFVKIVAREKELEFTKAKDITTKDTVQRERQVVSHRISEYNRQEIIDYSNRRIANVPDQYKKTFDTLRSYVAELEKRDGEEKYEASLFGIPYVNRIDHGRMVERLSGISEGMQAIATHLKDVKFSSDMSKEEAISKFEEVKDFVNGAESLKTDLAGIDYLPYIFDNQMNSFFLEKVDRKAFDVIKNLRIAKLQEELDSIPQKPTLFQRLTGKVKLNELRRENLRLRIENERANEYSVKRSYSILESLADVEAEKEILGYTNEETESFIGAVVSRYGD